MSVPRKLGFTTMGTPDRDHAGAIALASALGFRGVDLRCADHLGEVTPETPERELIRVGRDFDEAGIEIPSLLCYHRLNPASRDWVRRYADHVRRHLAIAAALGAHSIRVFGIPAGEDPGSDAVLGGCAEALASALAGDGYGVGVVIQNHAGIGTALDVLAIAQLLDDPRLGLVYSPDHGLLQGEEGPDALVPRLGRRIRQVYVADLVRDEAGPRWVPPGVGEVPLRQAVAALDASGFDGFYSFKWEKIWNPDLADPEEAFPRFLQFMGSL